MDQIEKIPVHIYVQNGKTICICLKKSKRCLRNCEEDVVERDRYADWESTFRRDKYGK